MKNFSASGQGSPAADRPPGRKARRVPAPTGGPLRARTGHWGGGRGGAPAAAAALGKAREESAKEPQKGSEKEATENTFRGLSDSGPLTNDNQSSEPVPMLDAGSDPDAKIAARVAKLEARRLARMVALCEVLERRGASLKRTVQLYEERAKRRAGRGLVPLLLTSTRFRDAVPAVLQQPLDPPPAWRRPARGLGTSSDRTSWRPRSLPTQQPSQTAGLAGHHGDGPRARRGLRRLPGGGALAPREGHGRRPGGPAAVAAARGEDAARTRTGLLALARRRDVQGQTSSTASPAASRRPSRRCTWRRSSSPPR